MFRRGLVRCWTILLMVLAVVVSLTLPSLGAITPREETKSCTGTTYCYSWWVPAEYYTVILEDGTVVYYESSPGHQETNCFEGDCEWIPYYTYGCSQFPEECIRYYCATECDSVWVEDGYWILFIWVPTGGHWQTTCY